MQATRTGVRRDPADESFLAPLVEATRRATGDARFAEHESAGRALSYDRAIEEVRAWLETVARSPLEVSRS
jgi:hypothetical protein